MKCIKIDMQEMQYVAHVTHNIFAHNNEIIVKL